MNYKLQIPATLVNNIIIDRRLNLEQSHDKGSGKARFLIFSWDWSKAKLFFCPPPPRCSLPLPPAFVPELHCGPEILAGGVSCSLTSLREISQLLLFLPGPLGVRHADAPPNTPRTWWGQTAGTEKHRKQHDRLLIRTDVNTGELARRLWDKGLS